MRARKPPIQPQNKECDIVINEADESVSPEIKAMIDEEDRWEEEDRIIANFKNDPSAFCEKAVEILIKYGRW